MSSSSPPLELVGSGSIFFRNQRTKKTKNIHKLCVIPINTSQKSTNFPKSFPKDIHIYNYSTYIIFASKVDKVWRKLFGGEIRLTNI